MLFHFIFVTNFIRDKNLLYGRLQVAIVYRLQVGMYSYSYKSLKRHSSLSTVGHAPAR